MRTTAFVILACLAKFAVCLTVLRKQDPKGALDEFAEKEKAKEFQGEWKEKGWQSSGKSCTTKKLPFTTDSVVFQICGANAKDGDKCVCNIAKAHSCHAGCRKIPTVCPAACKEKKCYQGAPVNGGMELSKGGNSGFCYNYCSQPIGGTRYCGVGGDYQKGLFLDCTGCSPQQSLKDMSPSEKKEKWTSCMADCFPTPSCSEMCGEGTPECYSTCVERYKGVVVSYWDLFKGSLQAVPLTLDGKEIDNEEEHIKMVEEVAEEIAEEPPVKEPVVEETPAEKVAHEEEAAAEKVAHEEEAAAEKVAHEEEEEEYMDEYGEDEYDDEEYDEDEEEWEEEEEGEWKDPWAGENEWEDDGGDEEYDDSYDFHIKRNRRPRLLDANDYKALTRQPSATPGQAPAALSQPRIHNLHIRKHRRHPKRRRRRKRRRHRHAKKDDPTRPRLRHKKEDPWKFYSKKPKLPKLGLSFKYVDTL